MLLNSLIHETSAKKEKLVIVVLCFAFSTDFDSTWQRESDVSSLHTLHVLFITVLYNKAVECVVTARNLQYKVMVSECGWSTEYCDSYRIGSLLCTRIDMRGLPSSANGPNRMRIVRKRLVFTVLYLYDSLKSYMTKQSHPPSLMGSSINHM